MDGMSVDEHCKKEAGQYVRISQTCHTCMKSHNSFIFIIFKKINCHWKIQCLISQSKILF